jgi:hypothetical protein
MEVIAEFLVVGRALVDRRELRLERGAVLLRLGGVAGAEDLASRVGLVECRFNGGDVGGRTDVESFGLEIL